MKIRRFAFLLVFCLFSFPVFASSESVDGVWKKMKRSTRMGDNLFHIDLAKKSVVFSYRAYGKMKLRVLSVKMDKKTSLPRYTVKVKGKAGVFSITVIRLSANKIYIGGGKRGWKIWGAYLPAGGK